jgi:hypothetical protein
MRRDRVVGEKGGGRRFSPPYGSLDRQRARRGTGRRSSAHRVQLRCRLLELFGRLLNSLAFVGGFDLANPCLLRSELVDRPPRWLMVRVYAPRQSSSGGSLANR